MSRRIKYSRFMVTRCADGGWFVARGTGDRRDTSWNVRGKVFEQSLILKKKEAGYLGGCPHNSFTCWLMSMSLSLFLRAARSSASIVLRAYIGQDIHVLLWAVCKECNSQSTQGWGGCCTAK